MQYKAVKTFICQGVLLRRGDDLPDTATENQIAHYLKTGMAEQHEPTPSKEQTAAPAKKAAAKPKTTKPAAPAETK